ncbi:hypothetical protein BGW38_003043, partial [Lunasporangiospora selenospora]
SRLAAAALALFAIVQVGEAVTWDPSFCSWEGTVPFCNSDCPAGNNVRCTTEKRSCYNGHKGLCCQSPIQAQCCRVMNNLYPNSYETLKEIDPEAAQKFYDKCKKMRDADQGH